MIEKLIMELNKENKQLKTMVNYYEIQLNRLLKEKEEWERKYKKYVH